jgi:signal peptidase complex subunit 2
VRLALGYSAFLAAGLCFLWDYKWGFESTKWLTAAAVAFYSLLNGALTLWVWLVEKGTVYAGQAPGGEKLRISTSTRKNVPQYHLTAQVEPAPGKRGRKETLVESRAFTDWFDATGHFVTPPFQNMLATAIPLVGKYDAKRVAPPDQGLSSAYTPEMLDALTNASVSVVGSAAETSTGTNSGAVSASKKGGKKRKA